MGEHALCGPANLAACGFTYEPESFMAAGVGVYNFSWRDMGVPGLDKVMDLVQARPGGRAAELFESLQNLLQMSEK